MYQINTCELLQANMLYLVKLACLCLAVSTLRCYVRLGMSNLQYEIRVYDSNGTQGTEIDSFIYHVLGKDTTILGKFLVVMFFSCTYLFTIYFHIANKYSF